MRTQAYSRMWNINQCLIEALHGVNIAGTGAIYFNKSHHGDDTFSQYHTEGTTIYSDIIFSIDWQEGEPTEQIVRAY